MEYGYIVYYGQTLQKTGNKIIHSIIYIFNTKTIKILREFKLVLESEQKKLKYYFCINSTSII